MSAALASSRKNYVRTNANCEKQLKRSENSWRLQLGHADVSQSTLLWGTAICRTDFTRTDQWTTDE